MVVGADIALTSTGFVCGGALLLAALTVFVWRSRASAAAPRDPEAASAPARSQPPLSAPAAPAFDPEQALVLFDGDAEFLRSILGQIQAEAELQVVEIKAALERSEPAKIHVAAHRLKGSLVTIAADPAATIALAIERAAIAGELQPIPPLVDALTGELDRLYLAFAAHGVSSE